MSMTDKIQWPTQCGMPDLSVHSPTNSLVLMLNRGLSGGGPKNYHSYALVMNFVLIVDKLLIDYGNARDAMQEFVSTPNEHMSPLFVAIGHLETSIATMIRAISFARAIRGDKNGPPVPRRIPVLSDTVYSRLNGMRNAIEHLDEEARNLDACKELPLCLVIENDRMHLFEETIEFAPFAKWIGRLHQLASDIARFKEP